MPRRGARASRLRLAGVFSCRAGDLAHDSCRLRADVDARAWYTGSTMEQAGKRRTESTYLSPRCPECAHEFDRRARRALLSPVLWRRRTVACPACDSALIYGSGAWHRMRAGLLAFMPAGLIWVVLNLRVVSAAGLEGLSRSADTPTMWVLQTLIVLGGVLAIHGLLTLRLERSPAAP